MNIELQTPENVAQISCKVSHMLVHKEPKYPLIEEHTLHHVKGPFIK